LLEDKIVGLGGKYAKADEPLGVCVQRFMRNPRGLIKNQAKVVVDGTLYTGQNPASAAPLAEAILAGLQK
jgi:putative intracellular protease/amidase